jgi:polyisoprenoid-binding protein YceI
MSKRTKFIVSAVVAMVVILAGGYMAFAYLAGGSSPAPVSLSSGSGSSSTGGTSSGGGGVTSVADLPGTWQLSSNGSFVGYRVREKLGILPAPSDAVGRTSAVQGSLVIEGTTVKVVDATADLTQLESDRSMRDERMRTIGLETDQFPTATFVLTTPISFASAPKAGTVVKTTATGKLTLHGVTRTVKVSIQAKWDSNGITVVGSLPIVMADYDITPPNVGGFVSVEDHGTMEFQLVFTKA